MTPLRFRLTAEVAALLVVLALAAFGWKASFETWQAIRAEGLARQASAWAEEAGDPRKREYFRREAAWFAHKAFVLRRTAIWNGLVKPDDPDPEFYDDRKLAYELGILNAIELHEMRTKQEHQQLQGGPTGP